MSAHGRRIPFVKMHGLGNDFVILDERGERWCLGTDELARLADRRFGIGCDQILILEPPSDRRARARYRVVNADGSAAEHCGNGVRCVARYLERRGEVDATVTLEIGGELHELRLEPGGEVRVDMGSPRFAPRAIPLDAPREQDRYAAEVGGRELRFGAVSVGNPHAVIEVDDVDSADVAVVGAALQGAALFPAGVNVGFMQVLSAEVIRLRVYERGAGETLACGTGACAAVAIGRRWGRLGPAVEARLSGGSLRIEWDGEREHPLWMTGPATFVFEGIIEP